jgi:uncharacterized metal-binding protein
MPKTAKRKPGPADSPSCSECGIRNCYRKEQAFPPFCLSLEHQDAALATKELYAGDNEDGLLARLAAEVEGEYYGLLTRVEESIIFAQKLKAKKLGIASCIGLLDEASLYAKIVRTADIEARTVICKVGALDKTEIGLPEDLKVCPGGQESCCNPVLQAQILNDWGADLNILIGLCVGHDALFARHSKAPAVTLIVKDRVLGHNPIAALHSAKFYYKRLLDRATFPLPRSRARKDKHEPGCDDAP